MLKVIRPRYDGREDLGSLTWSVDAPHRFVSSGISSNAKKPASGSIKPYAKCSLYESETFFIMAGGTKNCFSISYGNGNLFVVDLEVNDLQTFINKVSGVYLEYETINQPQKYQLYNAISKQGNTYQLYNMLSLSMKSLLGKQDVSATLTFSNFDGVSCDGNTFIMSYPNVSSKKVSIVNGHNYICLTKYENNVYPQNIYIGNDQEYVATRTIFNYGNNVVGNIYESTITTDKATFVDYSNGTPQGTIYKPIWRIIIDMTEIGCDNLTAQQFYDRFKDYFPLLASGKNIII